MSLGYDQGVTFGNRIDIFKSQHLVIFINLEARDYPFDNFAENTVIHDFSPWFRVVSGNLELNFASAGTKGNPAMAVFSTAGLS
jgi:hypothetical protein